MIDVSASLLNAGRALAVAGLLFGAAWLDSDYYKPRKGEVEQPKPVPDGDSSAERRDQLKVEVTPALIRNKQASLAALTTFYGLDARSSMPCSVRETIGPAADPKLEAGRPIQEGELAVLCLN